MEIDTELIIKQYDANQHNYKILEIVFKIYV